MSRTRRLSPGAFFGSAARHVSANGFSLSHRLADKQADEIESHYPRRCPFHSGDRRQLRHRCGKGDRRGRGPSSSILSAPPIATASSRAWEVIFAISVASPDADHLCDAFAHRTVRPLGAGAARDCRGAHARHDPGYGRTLHLESLCLELLGSLASTCGRRSAHAIPGWLARACEWIEDGYADDLDVAPLSPTASASIRSILRAGSAAFSLHRRRISPAPPCRGRGPAPDLHAASPCPRWRSRPGFADQSHFTKRFGECATASRPAHTAGTWRSRAPPDVYWGQYGRHPAASCCGLRFVTCAVEGRYRMRAVRLILAAALMVLAGVTPVLCASDWPFRRRAGRPPGSMVPGSKRSIMRSARATSRLSPVF